MATESRIGDLIYFHFNYEGLAKLKQALTGASKQVVDGCYKVLRVATEEFRRRVQRVSPVDTGRMRQGWVSQTERSGPNGASMTGVVGTSIKSEDGIPYPIYLELGTDRIAGGKVKAWQPGQAPILEWPAKMEDIPNFRLEKDKVYTKHIGGGKKKFVTERGVGKEGSAKFLRSVKIASMAFTQGEGEQMPMLRPIGYEMAPNVLGALLRTAQKGLADGLDGKKF